ncbi:microfibril-associated glycoprotein 4-like [Mytilus galloprovincialis]|uniref:microfibril-associated glycoprotein 4-like n=1 Tax=Mytilus galloprovincialis TaxID=29158 RepID=UPI003F7BD73A
MIFTSILLITAFVVMANSTKSQIKEISNDQKRSPSSERCHYRPTHMINECCPVTKPKDCGDIDPANCKSGVYMIYPVGSRPFDVYCKLINQGKAWTVIQRRFNGKINFNRTWKDYEYGFGTINGEHWLGNDKIHILTSKGDCLYQHNDKHFSTPDEDNDTHKGGNCADYSKAGFWFHKCTQSNLNGPYLKGETKTRKPGMTWPCWRGELYSLKTTTLMIRRI